MQPRSTMFAIVFTLAFFGPVAFAAEPEVFEVMDPGAQAIGYCQTLHRTADCSTYHVQGVTVTPEGTLLDLEGQPYLVEWTGPGYYLESGVVLQPLGEAKAGLGGQRWLEILPEHGKIHTSSAWKDQDGNRVLSVSDTLTLGTGKALKTLKVKDVRLHVRASPLPERPERPGPSEQGERPERP
jgi:hypothetical protein